MYYLYLFLAFATGFFTACIYFNAFLKYYKGTLDPGHFLREK